MVASTRSTIKGGSIIYVGRVAGMALSFPTAMMATAALGPADYGRWGAALALATLIKSLVSFETSRPLSRYLLASRREGDVTRSRALLSSALGCDLVTSAVALGLTAVVGLLTRHAGGSVQERLASILAALGLLLMFTDRTFLSVARDAHRYRLMAVYSALWPALQVVSIFILRQTGHLNLVTLAASYALTAGLTMLGQTQALRRLLPNYGLRLRQMSLRVAWRERHRLAEFWVFMGQMYVSAMLGALVAGGDMLIVRWLAGPEQTGYYKVAKQFSSALFGPTVAITTISYQHINEYLSAGQYGALRAWLKRLMKLWVPLYGGSVVAVIILLPWLVRTLFGPLYMPAALPSQVLAVGAGLGGVMLFAQPTVQLGGEYGRLVRFLALNVPVAILLMLGGARYAGAVGVAGALVLYNAANNLYGLRLAWRILQRRDTAPVPAPR